MTSTIAKKLDTLQCDTRELVARAGLLINDYDSERLQIAKELLVNAMEQLRQAVIARRAQDRALARHRSADPHCTCNDCIAYEQENQQ